MNEQEAVEEPESFEVCPKCEGRGKHVDPTDSVWTEEDRERDPDGFEAMMAGGSDVTCSHCSGQRVVRKGTPPPGPVRLIRTQGGWTERPRGDY